MNEVIAISDHASEAFLRVARIAQPKDCSLRWYTSHRIAWNRICESFELRPLESYLICSRLIGIPTSSSTHSIRFILLQTYELLTESSSSSIAVLLDRENFCNIRFQERTNSGCITNISNLETRKKARGRWVWSLVDREAEAAAGRSWRT